MKIDKEKLREVVIEANSNPQYKRLSIYSRPVAIIIRYLDNTTPQFSKGGAANELLTTAVKETHPGIWKILDEVAETISRKNLPEKIKITDPAIWERVLKETETKSGKMLNVFNPRTVAVFRYFAATKPRYNLNSEAVKLIEHELARRYPEVWEKVAAVSKDSIYVSKTSPIMILPASPSSRLRK